jgi:DNA-binding response OmpR family regulator
MQNKDKKTIMIIEDDVFVMDIYQTKLQKDGFDVMAAENGLVGLKKLENLKNIPDLILLDIVMPYMNGLEFLKKIKENETLKDIPVIMLTNLSQKEDVKKGFDLGAKDYLIKSHFTPTEVMNKINKYL